MAGRMRTRTPTASKWLRLAVFLALLTAYPPTPAEPMAGELRQALGRALDQPQPLADRYARQVWIQDYSNRLKPFVDDPRRRARLVPMIFEEARRAEVAPGLIFAIIQVESGFRRFALSPAGARGLMQIMPFWQEAIGRPGDNLFEPRVNLRYGCTILSHYLEREDGDILAALAAYHGSTGKSVYPRRILRAYRKRWSEPD